MPRYYGVSNDLYDTPKDASCVARIPSSLPCLTKASLFQSQCPVCCTHAFLTFGRIACRVRLSMRPPDIFFQRSHKRSPFDMFIRNRRIALAMRFLLSIRQEFGDETSVRLAFSLRILSGCRVKRWPWRLLASLLATSLLAYPSFDRSLKLLETQLDLSLTTNRSYKR